jgi:hypothetical protein
MFGSDDVIGEGEDQLRSTSEALKFNLVRAGVNTAQANVGSLQPRPRFQTNDADWSLTRKAKACDHAVKGVFDANDFYSLASEAFLDGAVSSLGAIKTYRENGKVKLERVYPGEILVDIQEGYYGRPRTLYQVKLVSKDVLKDQYPKHEREIDGAQEEAKHFFDWWPWGQNENQAMVIEGWHISRPKGKNGKRNGRRVVALSNVVLESEPWTRPNFPMAFYRWEKRQAGFYGRGIVEELRTHQRTLNYIDLRIRDMMHRLSRGKMVVWDNEKVKVNVKHLTNAPEDIVLLKGTGQPPTIMSQNAVPTEWWGWRREVIEDGLRQIGFSEFQVSATKPPGIEAAEALRELREQGTRRLRGKVQRFEEFVVEVAKLIVQELQEGAEAGDLDAIQAQVRKGQTTILQSVDWKKDRLDDDQYQLTVTPASSLPDSTAGRTATVTDWYKAGLITQVEFKALLDLPDLERFKSLDLAPYEVICDAIETMIEDGEYVHPEPTDDLELLVKLTNLSYAKFRLRKAPDDRLELLRRYMDDASWLIDKAIQGQTEIEQAAAAGAEAVAGVREAVPGPVTPYEAARVAEIGRPQLGAA